MHLDQYVVLHAAFVSALHKLVGIEFGERSRKTIYCMGADML